MVPNGNPSQFAGAKGMPPPNMSGDNYSYFNYSNGTPVQAMNNTSRAGKFGGIKNYNNPDSSSKKKQSIF